MYSRVDAVEHTTPLRLTPARQSLIAPWVASRTYGFGSVGSRTFISDEKNRAHILLTGASSDVWRHIAQGDDIDALKTSFANELTFDEIDAFIDELARAGLLRPDASGACAASVDIPPAPGDGRKVLERETMRFARAQGNIWSVHWEMTYRCNERCVHCLNPVSRRGGSGTKGAAELDTAEAMALIDDVYDIGAFKLILSGGECSVRRDFLDLLAYARGKGLSVAILTNAQTWNEAFIDRVAELWPNSIGISIYSANPELHDGITGVKGSFERSITALRELTRRGLNVSINSVQTKRTIQGYQLVKELAATLGVEASVDLLMQPRTDGNLAPLDLQVDDEGELVALAATPGSPIFVGGIDRNDKAMIERLSNADGVICNAGQFTVTVNPWGRVSPCLSLPLDVGSTRGEGLRDIWRNHQTGGAPSSAGVGVFQDWLHRKVGDLTECGQHDHCFLCALCPGRSMLEVGDLFAASPSNCRAAKARYTAMELMERGLDEGAIRARYGVSADFGRQFKARP